MTCYSCCNMMAASLFVCPHCGALQDQQSRYESAVNLCEIIGTVASGLLLTVVTVSVFESPFLALGGFILGLIIGTGIVEARYHWWPNSKSREET